MVVSKVRTRNNDDMVSLYIPMLSGYLPDEAISMLKEVKEAAAKKGGGKNASGRFLNTCTDTKISTSNSIPCRGVLQIKGSPEISSKLLEKLDAGT